MDKEKILFNMESCLIKYYDNYLDYCEEIGIKNDKLDEKVAFHLEKLHDIHEDFGEENLKDFLDNY